MAKQTIQGKTQDRIKRLFYDIEVSPNLCMVWQTGHQIQVDYNMIIQERAIICICYKWEGNSKVYSLTWDSKQSDKSMVKAFAKIIEDADEVIGHNGDRFDLPWLRTRCLKYGIDLPPYVTTFDTLKIARSMFRFNSNRLDYVGKYLEVGQKSDNGGLDTWKDIMFNKNKAAMDRMVKYCKQDVKLLEDVYDRFRPYIKPKSHVNGDKRVCPECGSDHVQSRGRTIRASGSSSYRYHCQDCGSWFQSNKEL